MQLRSELGYQRTTENGKTNRTSWLNGHYSSGWTTFVYSRH